MNEAPLWVRWMPLSPGLQTLSALQMRALFRRFSAFARRPLGAFALLAGIALYAAWIDLSLMSPELRPGGQTDVPTRIAWYTLATSAFVALGIGTATSGQLSGFRRSEVDHLLPAPLERRDILRWRLMASAGNAMLVAPMLLPGLTLGQGRFVGIAVGSLLSPLLLTVCTTAYLVGRAELARQLGERSARAIAWTAWLGTGALASWLGANAGGFGAGARRIVEGPLGDTLLRPMRGVAWLVSSPDTTALGVLTTVGGILGFLLVLSAITERLEDAFLGVGIELGERLESRLARVRRGGGAGAYSSTTWNVALPKPPWLGGVGPIAWARMAVILRQPGSFAAALGVQGLAIVTGWAFVVFGGELADRGVQIAAAYGVTLSLTIIPMTLRTDFRGELDRIVLLRSLPLGAAPIVTGVLLPMMVLLAGIDLSWATIAALARPQDALWTFLAALVLLPLSALLLAIDNAMFLLFPHRVASAGITEVDARAVLVQAGSLLVGSVLAGTAIAIGLAVGLATKSVYAAIAATFGLLSVLAAAALVLVFIVWVRFDVGRDLPA